MTWSGHKKSQSDTGTKKTWSDMGHFFRKKHYNVWHYSTQHDKLSKSRLRHDGPARPVSLWHGPCLKFSVLPCPTQDGEWACSGSARSPFRPTTNFSRYVCSSFGSAEVSKVCQVGHEQTVSWNESRKNQLSHRSYEKWPKALSLLLFWPKTKQTNEKQNVNKAIQQCLILTTSDPWNLL